MKKVLVTGASGFIGKYCVAELLKRGYEVHALSTQKKESSQIHWYQCNLLDSVQLKETLYQIKPTHILHLAWYAEHGKFWNSTENLKWVQASIHLLQTFVKLGGKRFVGAGTCAEYDDSFGLCIEESTSLAPKTLYGTCKNAFAQILKAYAAQSSITYAWGRVFHLYGPGEHPNRLVPSVINALLEDEPANCSHGEQIRDFLYVEDVASAFVSILESSIEGPINIASGEPTSLKSIILQIGKKLKKPSLIRLGALTASTDAPILTAANTRLTNEVGWNPSYNLDAGLLKTIGSIVVKKSNIVGTDG